MQIQIVIEYRIFIRIIFLDHNVSQSTTNAIEGTVIEDCAMFVLTTTLRFPLEGGSKFSMSNIWDNI